MLIARYDPTAEIAVPELPPIADFSTDGTWMPQRQGFVVVMTACIDPSTGPHKVALSNPTERLAEYRAALEFWLNHPDPRITGVLFIDNSGYPLAELEACAKRLAKPGRDSEFISLQDNYSPPGIGYGYSEFSMLDHGLAISRLARASRYWIKVSGRFSFRGISRLLDRLPADFLCAVDGRDNWYFVSSRQLLITTQFMILRADFFEKVLSGVKNDMTAPTVETFVYFRLIRYLGKPGVILRWPVNVDIVGTAGNQKNYDSPRQQILNKIRAVSRVVLPSWWV